MWKNQKLLLWDENPCLECISKPLVWLEKMKNEKKNLCYFLLAIFFMLFLLRNAFLRLKTFFQRILKIFLLVVWRIRDHFYFRIGVREHDFILNFWIWKPEDENRSEFRPAVNRIRKVLPRFKNYKEKKNVKKCHIDAKTALGISDVGEG